MHNPMLWLLGNENGCGSKENSKTKIPTFFHAPNLLRAPAARKDTASRLVQRIMREGTRQATDNFVLVTLAKQQNLELTE
jgi:hypothetical protein